MQFSYHVFEACYLEFPRVLEFELGWNLNIHTILTLTISKYSYICSRFIEEKEFVHTIMDIRL